MTVDTNGSTAEDLVERKAFENGIQESWEAMRRRARHQVGETWAEDIVMTAFATALSHERWREVRCPRTWIMGVLDNEIRSHHKKQGRIDSHEQAWETEIETLESLEGDLVDRMVEEDEVARQVQVVMDAMATANLSRREDYVVLARLRGKSDAQIAADLGIERNAVRAYHAQAIAKIRPAITQADSRSVRKT